MSAEQHNANGSGQGEQRSEPAEASGDVKGRRPEAFYKLQDAIRSKQATVGVIGLGYVGLPLVDLVHSCGFNVVGFDVDHSKVAKLRAGQSYIQHIAANVSKDLSKSARFTATTNEGDLRQCDVIIMCVPTPVGPHNEPDMSYVFSSTSLIAAQLTADHGTLIILESTTYPGATDTELCHLLDTQSASGCRVGETVFVAYSPEREDPANQSFHTATIPKLVGGVDEPSTDLAMQLYSAGGFQQPVRCGSARVAECAKLLENTYRAVNIALVNEMKQVFASMGVDVWDVLDAASTKPFGFHRFDPGPGIGGHCIPVDPLYLTWKARETGAPCSFIELAATVNAGMPDVITAAVQTALNGRSKSVKDSRILLLGIAYKPDVDDIREAPALVIWEKLLDLGANVMYYDPFVPVVCQTRKHMRLSQQSSAMQSEMLGEDTSFVRSLDAVLLVTNHRCFKGYNFLKGFKGPVIDTRNEIPKDMGLDIINA